VRVLDLFCGTGGAAMGSHRALPDAEIVGVDIKPQPRYPFEFVEADAMTFPLDGFDFVWASPPCQHYSVLTPVDRKAEHPDLIGATRARLEASGADWVMENVPGARRVLRDPIRLCGSSFGLPIWRHRYFEAPWLPFALLPVCQHFPKPVVVSGNTRRTVLISGRGMRKEQGKRFSGNRIAEKRAAMQIDWMTDDEITLAIPPAYSEYILRQWAAQQERVA